MTTSFAKQAIIDSSINAKIVSIDPEPRQDIDDICDEVIREGLECCSIEAFDSLEKNDILFFDGSHRTFMNSDVTVFFIDILPRIKPGVIIHLHDINLPWDYSEWAINYYWNEQYMLAVYMMNSIEKLIPLMPTFWICNEFHDELMRKPVIDSAPATDAKWLGGGSMWFTKK